MPAKKTVKKAAKKAAKKSTAKKSTARKTVGKATTKPATKRAAKKTAKSTAKSTPKAAAPQKREPTFEEIAVAAFLKHLNRKAAGIPDDPTADWLEAERELCGK